MTDAEARRIYEQIHELAEAVGVVAGDVKEIVGACKPCQKRVDRISTVVSGSNGEGLTARMARLEESRKNSSKLTALLSHAIAATIAAVVSGLVVAFFVR